MLIINRQKVQTKKRNKSYFSLFFAKSILLYIWSKFVWFYNGCFHMEEEKMKCLCVVFE